MSQIHALVIDDNVDNMSILAQMLNVEGVTCSEIARPNQQLESVLQTVEQLDLIFLDLELPNTDGFTIYANLRADARSADIPIIAYSVHTSEIGRVRDAGFDGFIGKPLDLDRFPDQLAKILRGEPVWVTA